MMLDDQNRLDDVDLMLSEAKNMVLMGFEKYKFEQKVWLVFRAPQSDISLRCKFGGVTAENVWECTWMMLAKDMESIERRPLDWLEYINSVNARRKSKSAKKPVNRKVWKTTGKVFKTVGCKWTPTGQTFMLVGNVCPLTRIDTAPIVPPREPIPTVQS
nr:hypothetical protein [Tanacetum cinerariifolium]